MTSDTLELQVDPYPATIQLLSFGAFVGGGIIGYIGLSLVFALQVCSVIGILGGVGMGTLAAVGTERVLKQNWESNRFFFIQDDKLELKFGQEPQRELDPNEHINVTAWYFVTRRRSRVPKGWCVVALALEQDDIYISIYTLMSSEDFQDFDHARLFEHLSGKRKDYNMTDDDVRVTQHKQRLLTAETARSIDGVEMTNDAFNTMIETFQQRFPQWMPKP
jgi:hypothetical protein